MNQHRIDFKAWHPVRALLLLSAALGLGATAWAAQIDVAQVPMVTSSATLVKPNLMFILDDSGSMGDDFMPDEADFSKSKYGFYASQCNGLAYNPTTTYALPVDSTGVDYPAGTFAFPSPASLNNIRSVISTTPTIGTGTFVVTLNSLSSGDYSIGAVVTLFSDADTTKLMVGTVTAADPSTDVLTVNVTSIAGSGSLTQPRVGDGDNRPFYYTYSGSQTRLGYTYTSSGVITSTTFYRECNSDTGSTPGSGVFAKVVMTPSSADLQNYRNWNTYHRTRSLTMRTAASLAFKPIGNNYRVGFSTISQSRVSGSKFLDVDTFDAAHKALFYTELFGASPGGYTPLRGALAKAGKYFAKKGTLTGSGSPAQTYDPVQYSCQRNYAILTTNGYWNTNDESTNYGPDKLDGTNVGQQDGGTTPRPMKDSTTTTVEERTSTLQQRTITEQWRTGTSALQQRSITDQWRTGSSALQQRSITPQWTTATSTLRQRSVTPQWTTGTSTLQRRTIVPWQTSTSTLQSRTTTLFEEVSNNSGASWGPLTAVASCQWDTNGSSRRRCSYASSWGAWSNVASCTTNNLDTGTSNGTTWQTGVQCQYTAWTAPVSTASCTAQAQDTTSPYTVGTATQCTPPVYGAWTNTATCTASMTLGCQYTAPVNTTTTFCTAVAQSPGPNYTVGTAVQCTALTPLYGAWSNVATCTASATNECGYTAPVNTTTTSCTAVAQSPGPIYTVGTAVQCTAQAPLYGPWTNTASCTTSATNGCQYAAAVNTTTTTCTPVAQSPGSPYTVATAVQCTAQAPLYGPWTNTPTCTTTATNGCQYAAPVNTTTGSCTPVAQSPGSPYTVAAAVQCTALTPLYGPWTNTATCTTSATNGCQYANWTSWSLVPSCTAVAQSPASTYTVGTARECRSTDSGGSSDSLADVAMYYYETDLRTTGLGNCNSTLDGTPTGIASNVCNNNVGPSGLDTALHQHMTTFTLGLGVSGTLRYQTDYATAPSGDFHDVAQGVKDWPVAGPSAEAENIDDLWHAAVNGRGRYFSAGDPVSLADSLSASLAAIVATVGSGSGAAASTLQPVAGDNKLFIAKYKSGYWIGDLVARTIDPVTGAISPEVWSAASKLQASVNAGTPRNIYYGKRNAGANTAVLRAFTYANLNADGLNGHFDSACTKTVPLTQCTTLTANKVAADAAYAATPNAATAAAQAAANAALASANSGSNMVSYLRGGSNSSYRARVTTDTDITGGILGDIIGGAPVYAGQPSFKYTENGYASFVAAVKATHSGNGRPGVAYAASNDGMLHAFDGATGNEKWAYVPSMVMDRMYRLADNDYAYRHEYFVNGAPVVGDIYVPGSPGTWKTILVGGLGAGGRGYYALDITDPDNPIALWEFTNNSLGGNDNLGQTFGNPVITKRADGTWVVVFASGYNNTTYTGDLTPGDGAGAGDGNGHLFMVNANTGQRLLDIPTYTSGTTPAGTATTPSGLAKLNAWVDSEIDNTAKRFYGGDVLGNLWRFDTDNLVAPNQAALRLAYFRAGGVAQPITTQPSLASVNYGGSYYPVVYVGTGKYIGSTDLTTTDTQSVYAIKDPMTNTPLGDVHASSTLIAQTLSLPTGATDPHAPRDVTHQAVNWSTDNGWRVDLITPTLPILGERVNVDMQLLHNTLTVASNIPSTDVCDAGGSSYLYQFDIGTGSIPSTLGGHVVGQWLGGSMVVGISWVTLQLPNSSAGSGRTITITVDNKGVPRVDDVPPPPPPPGTGRRTSWRELVN